MPGDFYDKLTCFIEKSGSRLPPREFYDRVNRAFHDCESENYDSIHREMFFCLDRIFLGLLSAVPPDSLPFHAGPGGAEVLDIGAGTGLVEELLFRSFRGRIKTIFVVDPNAEMTRRLLKKNEAWGFRIAVKNCYLEHAAFEPNSFDLVACSSVLHHIPDLPSFFATLRPLIRRGGLLLTMQDPRAEAWSDPVAMGRRSEHRQISEKQKPTVPKFRAVAKRLLPFIAAWRRRGTLEGKVNALLLKDGTFLRPLAMEEIWAITDIHVPDQPGQIGTGIARSALNAWLEGFEPIEYLTYNYFDGNLLQLEHGFARAEASFLASRDMHGFQFASLFRKVL
jgi:SAM-dependent methyltransferase